MKKLLSILVSALLLLTLLAACQPSTSNDPGSDAPKGKVDQIKANGKLVVYTDPNFAPFEFLKSNKPVGVDMEIAQAIADELGVTLEIQTGEFDTLIMAVKAGKGDIAVSGFTITDERKQSVDFSDPYINSVQYLILPEGSSLATVEDLAGKKIGVALGYTGSFVVDFEINDEEGVLHGTNTTFTEYPSAMEAVLDMNNGKVDAVVMDEYVAKNIIKKNQGLKTIELRYAGGDLSSEEYGVVVPKDNKDLLDVINNVVKKLLDEKKIEEWVVQYSE